MEIRKVTFTPLKIYSDEIINISYLRVLATNKFETYKLPTSLDKYKYKFILSPFNLITAEVVKTKKNWVLSTILESHMLCQPKTYLDYLKISELENILCNFFQEGYEVEIMSQIYEFFNTETSISDLSTSNFERIINKKLGFL